MKKQIRLTFAALLVVLSLVLTSCGVGKTSDKEGTESEDQTTVFTFGGTEVKKGEVYIYVNTVKERYELQYGDGVWDLEIATGDAKKQNMEALVREAVIAEIVKVKTLNAHAEEYGVSFSEEELASIRERADAFFEGLTDEDKQSMELDSDTVYRVFCENETAEEVKDRILTDNQVEISDEEARMTRFFDMYFPCFHVSSTGVVEPYSAEKKKEQQAMAVAAAGELATINISDSEITGIRDLAKSYGLYESEEKTMSPEEIKETYGEEIFQELYNMENGQYSGVMESEYGYHIFQMLELTAREATDEKKDRMREIMTDDMLKDVILRWQKEIDKKFSYPDSVDMEVYNTIEIKTTEE